MSRPLWTLWWKAAGVWTRERFARQSDAERRLLDLVGHADEALLVVG